MADNTCYNQEADWDCNPIGFSEHKSTGGTLMSGPKPRSIKDKFQEKYVVSGESGCWLWTASKDVEGYGQMAHKGKRYRSHRLSFELHKGEIPDGLKVLHKCDNPSCVNPDHLFLGTHQENMDDMLAKGRQQKGSRHAHSKITEEVAALIKKFLKRHPAQLGGFGGQIAFLAR